MKPQQAGEEKRKKKNGDGSRGGRCDGTRASHADQSLHKINGYKMAPSSRAISSAANISTPRKKTESGYRVLV